MTNIPPDELDDFIAEELGKEELDKEDLEQLTIINLPGDSTLADLDKADDENAKEALKEFGYDTTDVTGGQ